MTNTTPVAAYRGAGRPEAIHLMERMPRHGGRRARHRSRRDPPQELHPARRVPVHAEHRRSARRTTRGEYDKALDAALEHAGYDTLRAEQQARRERGDKMLLGIGVASYLEISAPMVLTQEYGSVEIEDDGTVIARVGTSSHGQGHETAFSQIIADTLGVPFENVRVLHSDTDEVSHGGGTGGSRSAQIGGSALLVASQEVLAQAKQLAAHLLEANPDDIVVSDGGLEVAGVPASKMLWADLAQAAKDPAQRPEGVGERLQHELDFQAGGSSFPFGSHVAVVEIDSETGHVELDASHRGRRLRQHHQPDDRGRPATRRYRAGCRAGVCTKPCSTTRTRTRSPRT